MKFASCYAMNLRLIKAGKSNGKIPIRTRLGKKASRQSTVKEGGKINDAKVALDKIANQTLRFRFTGRPLFSYFGEEKIPVSLVYTLFPNAVNGDWVEVPSKYWYLEGGEIEDIVNHQYILRDHALDSLMQRGLIKKPKMYLSIPLGHHSPYIGVYRVKPYVQKLITNEGRVLDTHSIAERGFKSRIITVSDWEYTVLAHFLLTAQQKLMSFDDTVPSLTGNRAAEGCRKKFVNYYKKPWNNMSTDDYHRWIGRKLLSTDLSRCSDLILPKLNKALLEGYNEGAGFYKKSCFLKHISSLLYAKRTITYRDGKGNCILPDLPYARLSPLMGDPCTWMTNNLYTKFTVYLGRFKNNLPVDQRSQYITILDRLSPDEMLEGICNIGIAVFCGDDVLADVGSSEEAHHIKATFEELGGKISEGTDILSEDKAIFCENIYAKGFETGQGPYLKYQDMIKIKQMTRPQMTENFDQVPPSWTAGTNSQKCMAYIDQSNEEGVQLFNTLVKVINFNNFDFVSSCRSFGLKPHFPTELGGAGYPVNPETFTDYKRSSVQEKVLFCVLEGASAENLTPVQLFELTSLQDVFSKYTEATVHGMEDNLAIERVLNQIDYIDRSDAVQIVNSQYKGNPRWKKKKFLETKVTDSSDGSEWIPFSKFITRLRNRLISNRGLLFDQQVARNPPGLSALKEVFDRKWQSIGAIFGTGMQQQHYITNVSLSADWDCITRFKTVISGFADQIYVKIGIIDQMHPKLTKDIPWVA
jgi:hypothetical protein